MILHTHGMPAKFGGASYNTYMLCELLISKIGKDKVHVICDVNNRILSESDLPNKKCLQISTVNIFCLIKTIFEIKTYIANNKIKIIHTHHRSDLVVSYLATMCIRESVKIVHTCHGQANFMSDTLLNYLKKKFYIWCLQRISSTIFISNFVYEQSKRHVKLSKDKKIIILNSSPLPKDFKTQTKVNISKGDFFVGMFCKVEGFKRPELLVELAEKTKEYRSIKYLLIGDGEKLEEIKKKSEDLDLNIMCLGYQKEPLKFMRICSLVISTSYNEPFGRTLTESLSLGIPILSFDHGGPKEIIENGVNGFLIEECDLDVFAQKIIKIFNDNTIHRRLIKGAEKIYKNKFSEQAFLDKHMNLYAKYSETFGKLF